MLPTRWPSRSCLVRCTWPTSENEEQDVRRVLLLCPGLVSCASNRTAMPHPVQQPTLSMSLGQSKTTCVHALLEGLMPTQVSFPLLPSGQIAPSEALVPVCFFHIREGGLEE
jgi:hypothetical protein